MYTIRPYQGNDIKCLTLVVQNSKIANETLTTVIMTF